jgi:hypothetical protein
MVMISPVVVVLAVTFARVAIVPIMGATFARVPIVPIMGATVARDGYTTLSDVVLTCTRRKTRRVT